MRLEHLLSGARVSVKINQVVLNLHLYYGWIYEKKDKKEKDEAGKPAKLTVL